MEIGTGFHGARALVTGGMGFTGSNLAIALVEAGADVTIVDAMIPGYAGNLFNIEPIKARATVNFCDVRDANAMNHLARGHDYVFHLAGQVDHILSMSDPFPDIDINIKGTAVVMEALRRHNPEARLIYTGTRGQYGPATSLPVGEDAPTHPKGIYEISNLTAEKIIQVYNDAHGIESVLLRLTNIYGPRAQMKHHRYGVVNWFARLAIDGETIQVFGDGKILRDFLYIDDAVEAIMLCALSPAGCWRSAECGHRPADRFRGTGADDCGCGGQRQLGIRALFARTPGAGTRRLLFRYQQDPASGGLAAAHQPARWLAPDNRLLSRAQGALLGGSCRFMIFTLQSAWAKM